MSTTATQAAQDVLERLNRAATLFGDPRANTDPEPASAEIPSGTREK